MNREQVSVDQIQQDIIKSVMFHDVCGAFVVIPVLWGCFMLIALPLELIFTSVPLGWIVTVFFLILELCYLAVICGTLICVKTLKFTVRTETLADKEEEKFRGRTYTPPRLRFRCGAMPLPRAQRYYSWSAANLMNSRDLYNTSHLGDSFAVVMLWNKIRVIYNLDIFDVQYPHD